jgi:hypothetical protein
MRSSKKTSEWNRTCYLSKKLLLKPQLLTALDHPPPIQIVICAVKRQIQKYCKLKNPFDSVLLNGNGKEKQKGRYPVQKRQGELAIKHQGLPHPRYIRSY